VEYEIHVACIFFLKGIDDDQQLEQLITHFPQSLFEGVGLPAAQEQFVTFVNATSDDALVKIAQLLTKRLLVLSEFSM